ncbi:glycosyltransferase [Candidatus Saccharibacteria bacterium]|nr:glycosyltransferase [Candidatus Saccharibacteria bacterium]
MVKPLLSIVIPVYNTGQVAGQIISRVLKQPMCDFELILVDDGSTDDSLAILRGWQAKDKRIKVLGQKHSGTPSAGRNTGLKKARGKYLMFLDSDDDIAPSMIPTMMERIQKDEADLVVCRIRFNTLKNGRVVSSVDIDKAPIPSQNKDESKEVYITRLLGMDGRLYHPSNKIFRTDIINQNHLRFNENLKFGEDLIFNLDYIKWTQKISFVDKPLYYYNFGTNISVVGKSALVYENRQQNFQHLLGFVGSNPNERADDLLGWVKFYWFFSFALAVCASNKKARQRFALLSHAIKLEQLTVARSSKYIGKNKYFTEIIISVMSKTPLTLYLLTAFANFIKNSRTLTKFWRLVAAKATA